MKTICFTIFIALLLLSNFSKSQDVSYLKEMPTSADVLNKIEGTDDLDEQYQQAAALTILNNVIRDLAGSRYFMTENGLTPLEKSYMDDYEQQIQKIYQNIEAQYSKDVMTINRMKFHYETDKEFNKKTLALLGANARKRYDEFKINLAEKNRKQTEANEESKIKLRESLVANKKAKEEEKRKESYKLLLLALGVLALAALVVMLYIFIIGRSGRLKRNYEMALRGTDKAAALQAGRKYYSFLRGGRLTIYDEQAIANDISTMKTI